MTRSAAESIATRLRAMGCLTKYGWDKGYVVYCINEHGALLATVRTQREASTLIRGLKKIQKGA